jgi:hypothetical protein
MDSRCTIECSFFIPPEHHYFKQNPPHKLMHFFAHFDTGLIIPWRYKSGLCIRDHSRISPADICISEDKPVIVTLRCSEISSCCIHIRPWYAIATCYGLDGPWIESRWGGRDFPRPSRPALGPPSLLYNGYRVFHAVKAAGAWRWPPTPSSTEVKERIELYLYSTSGPS